MWEYTQPDLLGGVNDDPGGMRVQRPEPRAHPAWEFIPAGKTSPSCAHCLLFVAKNPGSQIYTAQWRRYGRWGSTLMLCAGHRALQQEVDLGEPIGG